MSKKASKFFQAYVNEMIDIGGENLPKTISTKLGFKLGKIYKERGISNLESGLLRSFKVLNGKLEITKKNQKEFEINIKYKGRGFCQIGVISDHEKAKLIQESICIPFYIGFLNGLCPKFKYSIRISNCILISKKNFCRFTITLDKKES